MYVFRISGVQTLFRDILYNIGYINKNNKYEGEWFGSIIIMTQ